MKTVLSQLAARGYRFTTVTPETHLLVNSRPGNERARSLRDVFGWNRSFLPETLPQELFDATRAANACEQLPDGSWRATFRVASLGHQLFAHSSFPTDQANAVFFGPDSYRFARAIRQLGVTATRAVDVGCGSGVGGIVLSHLGGLATPVVLSDINEQALELSRVNADVAGVAAEIVNSDVLRDIDGVVDLIIANPPYLVDEAARTYRDGGAAQGAALSARFVEESLARLDRDGGGSLLIYTGVACDAEGDPFWNLIEEPLKRSGARHSYEELDPDIFASELQRPAYSNTERIAAVLLRATLGKG
jgi:SAM-dependent methyltransferase